MRTRFLFLLLLVFVGCVSPATQTAKTSNSAIQVELLFENDGVKVYRFSDGGRYIYYTDARGSTQWRAPRGKHSVMQRVETVQEVAE